MIASVADFARYFEGVRRRTWAAVDRITPALAGWAPRPGEFTCAAIVRHLAGAERFFVTRVVDDRWTDDLDVAADTADLDGARAALRDLHAEAMGRLAALPDARLAQTIVDLEGRRVRVWRFLMAMVEHEIHHRSQLDAWLALAGVEPPQVFGYRMEDVVARARGAPERRP
ncbi:MAG TPA: DinB family protein [Candidatus Tectomicrobia bacterium]|nr:DinB family protein [Candidatus Tectomicrobia bacterium]